MQVLGPESSSKPVRSWPENGQARVLRHTAVVFAVAVAIHGLDHLRRGPDVVTDVVRGAGATQFVLAGAAVMLVFRRHPFAPALAAFVGLASAVLFVAAHLLPQWSAFSDPYTGAQVAPGVTGFSWFTALFEIAADTAFGVAGLRSMRAPAVVA
jgi:hypothetical protein